MCLYVFDCVYSRQHYKPRFELFSTENKDFTFYLGSIYILIIFSTHGSAKSHAKNATSDHNKHRLAATAGCVSAWPNLCINLYLN